MEQQKNSRPAGTGTTETCKACKKQTKQHKYYNTDLPKNQAFFASVLCVTALTVCITAFSRPNITLEKRIHRVKSGETLWTIAKQYKPDEMTMDKYMEFIYENNLNADIFPGDIVTVGVWEE